MTRRADDAQILAISSVTIHNDVISVSIPPYSFGIRRLRKPYFEYASDRSHANSPFSSISAARGATIVFATSLAFSLQPSLAFSISSIISSSFSLKCQNPTPNLITNPYASKNILVHWILIELWALTFDIDFNMSHIPPTGNLNHGSRHKTRFIRYQKSYHIGHFFGLANALQRCIFNNHGLVFLSHLRNGGCQDQSRQNHIDIDLIPAQFPCNTFRQANDPRFGRTV